MLQTHQHHLSLAARSSQHGTHPHQLYLHATHVGRPLLQVTWEIQTSKYHFQTED
jgi:hypothetical protein